MRPSARGRLVRLFTIAFYGACVAGAGSSLASGCSGWDPRSPFERNAPEVDEAIKDLDAGQMESAEQKLERYLNTGHCSGDAGIGAPASLRQKPDGTFDLGLTLFGLGERFGTRFGDEELADGGPAQEQLAEMRSAEIDCALLIVRAIDSDHNVPAELRARAHYLAGNLEFLRKKYEDAVKEYDQALSIVPGLLVEAGGDGIGRDAAWNRAIALRRIEDQKDASPDSPDAPDSADGDDGSDGSDAADGSDGADGADGSDGSDGGNDAGDAGKDAGEDGGKDAGEDGGDKADGGQDGGSDGGAKPDAGQPQQPPPQKASREQDDRMLDQLEEKPTYQEQEAKQRANRRGRPMMVDK